MSHGESFLSILDTRFDGPGFYVLDEPESALSFTGCLALVARLHELTADGRAQAVLATHSPIIAAIPGAQILEEGEWGLRRTTWEDLELVGHWRRFLDDPEHYLRRVLAP
jgi:predicted ATPase